MENLVCNSDNIPIIESSINFWLVRSKKGYFFDEFINQNFVALGWNIIDSSTDFSDKSEEKIKKTIEEEYSVKPAQASVIYNKCRRFINEVKENDIIMIPSAKSKRIAFARVKDYYEDSSKTLELEKEEIEKINLGLDMLGDIKCPYKKRRKIEVLKIIPNESLNFNLYKALNSYHGISSLNDYKEDLLNTIYNLYYLDNKVVIKFNVNRTESIDSGKLCLFISQIDSYIKTIYQVDDVPIKLNLHSPGDIIFEIKDLLVSTLDFAVLPVCILLGITGGKIGALEVKNSIIDMVEYIRFWKLKKESKELENKKKELENEKLVQEIETQKLQNERMALENKKLRIEVDEKEKLEKNLIDISDLAKYLNMYDDEKIV